MTLRTNPVTLLVVTAAWLGGSVSGLAADAPDAAAFLARVREPFRQDAWGRFTGTLLHLDEDGKTKRPVAMTVRFTSARAQALIVLDQDRVYRATHTHGAPPAERMTLQLPDPDAGGPCLADFGLEPQDVTLSFLYWELVAELAPDYVRHQPCRVLELRHPQKPVHVRAWFSRDYLFPLRVEWYRVGEPEPWRELEFREFKKYSEQLWFMKTVQLRGDGWKTRVTFDQAELHMSADTPVPDDLFGVE